MTINFSDGTWRQVSQWAEQKLKTEREKNDGVELDPVQTAVLRGRISLLKELLALPRVKDAEARARIDQPE